MRFFIAYTRASRTYSRRQYNARRDGNRVTGVIAVEVPIYNNIIHIIYYFIRLPTTITLCGNIQYIVIYVHGGRSHNTAITLNQNGHLLCPRSGRRLIYTNG